jgi:hypothetical protein
VNVEKLAPYAKTVVAVAGAVVTTASCLIDGNISSEDVVIIVTAWSTVFGVYQATNKK